MASHKAGQPTPQDKQGKHKEAAAEGQTCLIQQLGPVALLVDMDDLRRPPAAVVRPVQLQPLLLQLWLDVCHAQQHLLGGWLLPGHLFCSRLCKCTRHGAKISPHSRESKTHCSASLFSRPVLCVLDAKDQNSTGLEKSPQALPNLEVQDAIWRALAEPALGPARHCECICLVGSLPGQEPIACILLCECLLCFRQAAAFIKCKVSLNLILRHGMQQDTVEMRHGMQQDTVEMTDGMQQTYRCPT